MPMYPIHTCGMCIHTNHDNYTFTDLKAIPLLNDMLVLTKDGRNPKVSFTATLMMTW